MICMTKEAASKELTGQQLCNYRRICLLRIRNAVIMVCQLIPTGVVYYFLMKTMKSSKGFRKGTIFED